LLLGLFSCYFEKCFYIYIYIYIYILNASIFIGLLIQSAHLQEPNATTVCTEILAFQITVTFTLHLQITHCVWAESQDCVKYIRITSHLICMLQCPQEGRSSFVVVFLHHSRVITSLITQRT